MRSNGMKWEIGIVTPGIYVQKQVYEYGRKKTTQILVKEREKWDNLRGAIQGIR